MKPSLPKGTRDFSPGEMARRNFILDTIRTVYERHGYRQIETPAMENLSVLEGKYGEEGDALLFRILNSGPVLDKQPAHGGALRVSDIAGKGLRYDLTVPFARYVVMHRNDIVFPFKRYQVQPVWRADRPQKGRYREFVQCDADVIGSDALVNEVEMAQMISEVFDALGLHVTLKVNNRKVLAGVAEVLGVTDRFGDLAVALDKLDKAGFGKVKEELEGKGFSGDALDKLERLLADQGPWPEHLAGLAGTLAASGTGVKGIEELLTVLEGAALFCTHPPVFDLSLARGLDYYTGTIFEVKASEPGAGFSGSLLGGGRYDNLTGIFGLAGVSGVGISFGVDRIYDVMEALGKFGGLRADGAPTRVLFVNFGKEEEPYCMALADAVRKAGIPAEVYPDAAKVKKQMSYADTNGIPLVALIGSEEMKAGRVTLKNMKTGTQREVDADALVDAVSGAGDEATT